MQHLLTAYRQTHYRVQAEPAFTLFIGQASPPLRTWYTLYGVQTAAFITAHNPFSTLCSAAANAAAQQQLETHLASLPLHWLPGVGEAPDNHWPAETSCLVLGMTRQTAETLCQHFQQNAFVFCEQDTVPTLVMVQYPHGQTVPSPLPSGSVNHDT